MKFERFIASRTLSGKTKGRFSRPIVRIAVAGIAIGMAVMILSLAIMNGFQGAIREKAIGFGAHIQVMSYTTNNSLEADPVAIRKSMADSLKNYKGVRHVQSFGVKAGIIKAGDELQGVVLKGVGPDFDWDFFKSNIKSGTVFQVSDTGTTDRVLISRVIADKMKLEVGKKFRMYFIQDKAQRVRVFRVSGIYETGLEGFDDVYVLADMKHVQSLNQWEPNESAGFEVLLYDFHDMAKLTDEIRYNLPSSLNAVNVSQSNPQIFSWLDVIDVNAVIIIGLMLFVGVINMISALFILILERTNMIGILKALGASNRMMRKIFLFNGISLILRGMLLGNIFGFGLAVLQQRTGMIKLDQESYYVPAVPIHFDWWQLLGLNGLCLAACMLALFLPTIIISNITPVKAIRFS